MGGIQTARLSNTLAQEMLYERDGEALGLTMNLLCLFAFTYCLHPTSDYGVLTHHFPSASNGRDIRKEPNHWPREKDMSLTPDDERLKSYAMIRDSGLGYQVANRLEKGSPPSKEPAQPA